MICRPNLPRLLASALLCLLLASAVSAQCTTPQTPVSGSFAGGGVGSAPLTQSMTATGVVSGSNLVVSITYDLTPNAGAGTVTQLQVVFGAGFTGTVDVSTSANNITYNVSAPGQSPFAPSPAVSLPTSVLAGGAMRAQGTVTIPLGGNVVTNGALDLRPMINGSFTPAGGGAARFSIANNFFSVPTSGQPTEGNCVTGIATGNVLIGPQGQPAAVGPTDADDDYTNKTLTAGVSAAAGGVTTAAGTVNFVNTIRNASTASDTITLTAPTVPAGFTVQARTGANPFVTLSGGGSVAFTVAAATNLNVDVRVTAPSGIAVLQGFAAVLRVTSGLTPSATNDTIDRVYSGFVRVDKTQAVTNSTGVGGATQPVTGAVIQYSLTYRNVTPAASGTGNVELFATNLTLTEDGAASPNNWASTTDHVPGQASDSRGGTITGDTAGSSLITDVVPRLDPAQSGVFRYSRRIK